MFTVDPRYKHTSCSHGCTEGGFKVSILSFSSIPSQRVRIRGGSEKRRRRDGYPIYSGVAIRWLTPNHMFLNTLGGFEGRRPPNATKVAVDILDRIYIYKCIISFELAYTKDTPITVTTGTMRRHIRTAREASEVLLIFESLSSYRRMLRLLHITVCAGQK